MGLHGCYYSSEGLFVMKLHFLLLLQIALLTAGAVHPAEVFNADTKFLVDNIAQDVTASEVDSSDFNMEDDAYETSRKDDPTQIMLAICEKKVAFTCPKLSKTLIKACEAVAAKFCKNNGLAKGIHNLIQVIHDTLKELGK